MEPWQMYVASYDCFSGCCLQIGAIDIPGEISQTVHVDPGATYDLMLRYRYFGSQDGNRFYVRYKAGARWVTLFDQTNIPASNGHCFGSFTIVASDASLSVLVGGLNINVFDVSGSLDFIMVTPAS